MSADSVYGEKPVWYELIRSCRDNVVVAGLLYAWCTVCHSPYVIGTMNQSSSNCHADLQMHHNFRWVLYANHIEPVRSFLGRYLRRQLATATAKSPADVPRHGSALMALEKVVEWLPKVWQRINRFLESQTSFDVTIGTKNYIIVFIVHFIKATLAQYL